MQNLGRMLQMEILTKQAKLNNLTKLVDKLDKVSSLAKLDLYASRKESADIDSPLDTQTFVKISRMAWETEEVSWLYRESSDKLNDSGWRIYQGAEEDEYLDTPANFMLIRIQDLVTKFPQMANVLRHPVGSQFEWHHKEFQYVELS